MEPWIIWLIAAAVLIIIEVLSQMVWTLCLAIGCLAALIVSLAGGTLPWQITAMALAALVAYIALVPRLKKWLYRSGDTVSHEDRTGMDALLGRSATVTHEIKPGELGRVRIDGDSWQAKAPGHHEVIRSGSQVKVTSYDSIILTVE